MGKGSPWSSSAVILKCIDDIVSCVRQKNLRLECCLSHLGWTQDEIERMVGMSRGRITQIVNNASFSEINNLLSQGNDMKYIARHCNMDFPLVWEFRGNSVDAILE